MNKENRALKMVDEIILYYDARSKEYQIVNLSLPIGCTKRGLHSFRIPQKCLSVAWYQKIVLSNIKDKAEYVSINYCILRSWYIECKNFSNEGQKQSCVPLYLYLLLCIVGYQSLTLNCGIMKCRIQWKIPSKVWFRRTWEKLL